MTCGTEPGYREHLKRREPTCPPCRAAHCADVKRKLHQPRRVDPAAARAHIDALVACGMTAVGVATRAGITHDTVNNIRYGHTATVHRRIADAILAIEPEIDATALIDPTGTFRRIRALMALGYRHDDLHGHSGIRTSVLLYQREWVTARTAERVTAMYDALCMTPGPSSMAHGRAAKLGYIPPLGWNDDDIDDPAAWADPGGSGEDIVDPEVVRRLIEGRTDWRTWATPPTQAERLAAADVLPRTHDKRLGIGPHTRKGAAA